MASKPGFVENGFVFLSMNAAVQHNSLYSPQDSTAVKTGVRREFRGALVIAAEPFLARCPTAPVVNAAYGKGSWLKAEAEFLSAVVNLRSDVRSKMAKLGSQGKFRVSHAQKSLALLLKYYWCANETKVAPPFCPIDRTILECAGIRGNWTQLDNMATYATWLNELTKFSSDKNFPSLADWELAVYW